ncbi:MAG: hypothetical protein CMJ39_12770 [Phycisphaerae bacterium]|nr:hypothetical protein [Phycisphaerae bacterium]
MSQKDAEWIGTVMAVSIVVLHGHSQSECGAEHQCCCKHAVISGLLEQACFPVVESGSDLIAGMF